MKIDGFDTKQYEKLLAITIEKLPEELAAHPEYYYRVSKALATLTDKRDKVKQEMRDMEADAGERLRSAFTQEEGKPPSEERLKRLVQLEMKKITHEYLDLCYQVNALTALEGAWMQRSYMLTRLAEMHGSEQYGYTYQQKGGGRDYERPPRKRIPASADSESDKTPVARRRRATHD